MDQNFKKTEGQGECFTAMMIHELRTPLTTIIYSIDMLLSDINKLPPAKIEEYLCTMKSTANEMSVLINDLLDVAKIEARKFVVTRVVDDLGSLIEKKINLFKPITNQKGIWFTAELDPNLKPFPFDQKRLGEVLDNLISNALKYTDKGSVTIKTETDDNQVTVSVVDTGEGIKREDFPRLFSKFEQLGKGKTGEKRGTGLGLVISKGIIEAHGGKIWAVSEGAGKGAAFSFTIPL